MRFEPVDLGFSYRTIRKTHGRYTLELSPVTVAVQAIQPRENMDASTTGDRLDGMNFADYLEFQALRLTQRVPLSKSAGYVSASASAVRSLSSIAGLPPARGLLALRLIHAFGIRRRFVGTMSWKLLWAA